MLTTIPGQPIYPVTRVLTPTPLSPHRWALPHCRGRGWRCWVTSAAGATVSAGGRLRVAALLEAAGGCGLHGAAGGRAARHSQTGSAGQQQQRRRRHRDASSRHPAPGIPTARRGQGGRSPAREIGAADLILHAANIPANQRRKLRRGGGPGPGYLKSNSSSRRALQLTSPGGNTQCIAQESASLIETCNIT